MLHHYTRLGFWTLGKVGIEENSFNRKSVNNALEAKPVEFGFLALK